MAGLVDWLGNKFGVAGNPVIVSDISGGVSPSTTGTPTSVASANADTVILALNALRKGAIVFNDSTSVLYLLLKATTASATVFTYKMQPGDTVEIPFNYTGGISGFWAAANGNARVTELT